MQSKNFRDHRRGHALASLLLVLALGACRGGGSSTDAPAGEPASVERAATPAATDGTAPTEGTAEADGLGQTPEGSAEEEAEVPQEGTLRITGSHDGVVFVNGARWADWVPVAPRTVEPGRFGIQVLYADRELSPPRFALVRPGTNVVLYIRYEGSLDEATVPRASSTAESLPPAGDAPVRAVPEAEDEPAEGAAEGSGEPAEGDAAEGSGEAAVAVAIETSRVVVTAEQGGTLFIDGQRTEHVLPVDIHVPVGRRTFQVLYDDGTLSRHIERTLDVNSAVHFSLDGSHVFRMRVGQLDGAREADEPASGEDATASGSRGDNGAPAATEAVVAPAEETQ